MRFKVDTCASVTAIPETEFKQDRYGRHSVLCRPLLGPANQPLDVKGQVYAVIQREDRKIEEEGFILQPQWPDLERFREKDTVLKLKQQRSFNQRHRTQTLPHLQHGQHVWIKPTCTRETVVSPAPTPRSYEVETLEGGWL
ncbi:unnamed protein product [Leuciscus chuanchicus]